MSFPYRTRRFVNDLLSPVGLAINRAEKQPWKWFRARQRAEKEARQKIRELEAALTIQVGCYSIQIPSQSPLSAWYGHQALELGRLTMLVKKKFSFLAVVDIGPNVGDTACIIKTAEEVPILCIEGDEYIFDFLQKNIAQFQNVTTRKLFLGEATRKIRASFEKSGWNLTLKPNETPTRARLREVSQSLTNAVIRVCNATGNMIETHEHAGEFKNGLGPFSRIGGQQGGADDMLSSFAEGSQSSIFRIWKVDWRYPGLLENALSLERNDGRVFGGM
jgi:hypothetical protein